MHTVPSAVFRGYKKFEDFLCHISVTVSHSVLNIPWHSALKRYFLSLLQTDLLSAEGKKRDFLKLEISLSRDELEWAREGEKLGESMQHCNRALEL
jgi:hypothetical protein